MNFAMIAIMVVAGLLGGWLAGFVMKGGGYGLIGDIALGVVGGIWGGSAVDAGDRDGQWPVRDGRRRARRSVHPGCRPAQVLERGDGRDEVTTT